MDRILVVNLNWLGDVLFTVPALKTIKKSNCNIYLAVALPSRCKRLLEFNPIIDEIIEFDERTTQRSLIAKIKFILQIKKKQFDKVIFFHRSSTRIIIFTLCGIPYREGYCRKKTRLFLTTCIPDPGKDSMHKAKYYLNLVNQLGYRLWESSYEFYITEEDICQAENILKQLGINLSNPIICLHPGANWPPKRWPLDYYPQLIKLIWNWNPEINFVIVGTSREKQLAEYIIENTPGNKIFDLTGKTTLGTLGGLFSFTDILISPDSGPLHICAALQIPNNKSGKKPLAIGLYGPTSQSLTGPLSGNFIILEGKRKKDCLLPCYNFRCQDIYCMHSIKPKRVAEKIQKYFNNQV